MRRVDHASFERGLWLALAVLCVPLGFGLGALAGWLAGVALR